MAEWRKETKGRATYRHTPVPTKKILQLHEGLSKRESALLVQLRTEKIGLKDFLFQRKMPDVPSPRCECGERRQTVAHILLHSELPTINSICLLTSPVYQIREELNPYRQLLSLYR